MGVYVYTMRKKTRKVNGTDVRFFSFAYKPSYSFCPTGYSLERSMQRYDAAAEAAFADYDGGPVMIADPEDKDLNGARVYRNVKSSIWNDAYEFPGEFIGYIKQNGRKLSLVGEHRWRAQHPNDRTFVECIKDGKPATRVEMDNERSTEGNDQPA